MSKINGEERPTHTATFFSVWGSVGTGTCSVSRGVLTANRAGADDKYPVPTSDKDRNACLTGTAESIPLRFPNVLFHPECCLLIIPTVLCCRSLVCTGSFISFYFCLSCVIYAVPVSDFLSGLICSVRLDTAIVCFHQK